MSDQQPYVRTPASSDADGGGRARAASRVSWAAVVTALVLTVAQVLITVYANHVQNVRFTATQLPVLSFVALVLLVLVLNPVLKRIRGLRPFNRAELLTVFAALFVTGGISVYGFVDQLVPMIATPFNPKWNTVQRGWDTDVIPYLDARLFLRDPESVVQFREGLDEGQSLLRDVPWGEWVGPLFHWGLFAFLIYAMFYFLSAVLYRQWAYREKLIFPLTKLPESLLPDESSTGSAPSMFRMPQFWIGFGISFLVLFWNGSVREGWIHGLGAIPLDMNMDVLDGTFLKSLRHTVTFHMFFTALGIAFLLPPEITFSVWFYFLLHALMVYVASQAGFGVNEMDFPRNMRSVSNFITAQGGGAMMAFGLACLVKALLGFRETARGRAREERLRMYRPVFGLFGSLLLLVWWMTAHFTHSGLPARVMWATLFVIVILLMTISLMRMVVESGLFGFQAHTGPFHLAHIFNVNRFVGAGILAPLVTFHSIFFYDVKTFLAPALMNAEKLRDDSRGPLRRFHGTVIAAIVLSVIVSVIFSICLAYRIGGQQMQPWFYTHMTPMLLDTARDLAADRQDWTPANLPFVTLGAVWIGITLVARQFLFWFPHPIGYIIFANPLTRYYWFSFLIAWAIKAIVLKYGGRSSFDKVKPFFIGLIMGELMAVTFWVFVVWGFDLQNTGIDIDRHAPSRGTGG